MFSVRDISKNWNIPTLVLALFIALPLLVVALRLFLPATEVWQHLRQTVLFTYISNSIILTFSTIFFSTIMGLGTAWVVSVFEFRGRGILEWMLVLPLAIPSYIAAYAQAGFWSYTGFLQQFTRNVLHWQSDALVPFDVMSFQGAILVLSCALYPYIYIVTRAAFISQSQTYLEASQLLGKGHWVTFWRVGLPMARPALVGGASLVAMEVLNDYGAVQYYGIPTLTTGIFRSWLSLHDLDAAMRLSSILLLFIFSLLTFEQWQRHGRRFVAASGRSKPLQRQALKGFWRQSLAQFFCLIPISLGFLLPLVQLSLWARNTFGSVFAKANFWQVIANSYFLAGTASLIIVVIALFLAYTNEKTNTSSKNKQLVRLATIGYAIPGAVIAVGVMLSLRWLDSLATNFFFMGTTLGLLYAYLVRFLAVGFQPIDAGFKKVGTRLGEVSSLFGKSAWFTFFKIYLPIVKPNVLAAALLVFVDVVKELPLTLVLRPFNFETVATKTFEMAANEMLDEAAVYALLIIVMGLLPILFLHKLTK